MSALVHARRRGGFTLVELLTVMAILGILVGLVVGAGHAILQHAARTETEQTIAGIQAGLSRYFEDWHKYPWYEENDNQWGGSGAHPLMGVVREGSRDEAGYRPLDEQDMERGDPGAACLYASLSMDERSGPYFIGSGGNVQTLAYRRQDRYSVFVDGWQRPIHYFQPPPKPGGERPAGATTSHVEYYRSAPLLMSEGPEKDMPDADETMEDNVFNYEIEDALRSQLTDKYHQ